MHIVSFKNSLISCNGLGLYFCDIDTLLYCMFMSVLFIYYISCGPQEEATTAVEANGNLNKECVSIHVL